MKKKIDKELVVDRKSKEPKWYELNNKTKFYVKPFPFSQMTALEVMPMMLEQFMFCLIDWEGINEDGNKLPVNDDNKRYLYDYYPEIRDFVIGKSRTLTGFDPELKN